MNKIKQWLTKEVVFGIARHLLTWGGGLLVAQGKITNDDLVAGVGAGMTLIGIAMSANQKVNAAQTAAAAVTVAAATGTTVPAHEQVTGIPKGAQVLTQAAGMIVLLFALVIPTSAQTTNNPVSTNQLAGMPAPPITFPAISIGSIAGVNTNVAKAANDFVQIFAPLMPFLTNRNIQLDMDAVYSQKTYGGIADLQFPITANLSLGGGAAYVQNQWFVVALSTKLGSEFTIPVWQKEGYAFAETGLAQPMKRVNAEDQSVAGAVLPFDISKNVTLLVEAGIGKETSLPGAFYFGGASVNIKW